MYWLRAFLTLALASTSLCEIRRDPVAPADLRAPRRRDGVFPRASLANSTITSPAVLPTGTASTCPTSANCHYSGPDISSAEWAPMSITTNITVATLVYIVNNRTNTTRTSTILNTIPEGYTQQPTNSDGTAIYPLVTVAGNVTSTTSWL